jgi:ATP-dependent Clp protease ATP-binding subunit ClpA
LRRNRTATRSESFATSVEVLLSADSKKVLHFEAEEADRLGQRHIGTEHMLLGLLRVQGSLGAQVARARGLKAEELREMACKRAAAGGFLEAVPSDTGSTGRFLDGTEVALRSGFDGIFR